MFVCSLLRGSKRNKSVVGIKRCTEVDFTLLGLLLVIIAIISYISFQWIIKNRALKQKINYPIVPSDINWTKKLTINLMSIGFIGGMTSGFFGLGGSIIYSIIFLSMGIAPLVTSASGMYIVMFSSLSSSLLFSVTGTLNLAFAFWVGAMVFIST